LATAGRARRVGKCGPELTHLIAEPSGLRAFRVLASCGQRIVQRLVGVGVDQQHRHLVVQLNQRVQRERVVGVEIMKFGQRCALALEMPTGEIEPVGCQPLSATCQTVVVEFVENLVQYVIRIGHAAVVARCRPRAMGRGRPESWQQSASGRTLPPRRPPYAVPSQVAKSSASRRVRNFTRRRWERSPAQNDPVRHLSAA
jgi:hypothetical protein